MAPRSVYKKYGNAEHYSITDSNLEITDRELIVSVGPSGYDKSATLRMIAGSEGTTGGGLSIGDKVMNDVVPKDRDIAMVLQDYALYPYMAVFDNMAFGSKLRKYDKAEIKKRAENATSILGLVKYLQCKPAALPSGQRQHVALGRTIVHDAGVFLVGEPLPNLDAKLRVAMRAEIVELHQRLETTTIYATHDQIGAMTMADRAVIMKDGFIQQIGSSKGVYNTPKDMFIAGFIGSPAMNFFKATLNNRVISNQHSLKLAIPEGRNKELVEYGYEGKELILDIRPKDTHNEQVVSTATGNAVIKSEVVVSELLRVESMLYTRIGDAGFISKVDAYGFHHPSETTDLAFNTNEGHFFDPQTEEVTK